MDASDPPMTAGDQQGDPGLPDASGEAAGEDAVAERITREAKANLRSLVSDDAAVLPSLGVLADGIRLELEDRGEVAILYVKLKRYGRLEQVFGWRIVADILEAVAQNLQEMVGNTLRRLDVLADFTLSDNAFVVVLSPPRSRQTIAQADLVAVGRRVYERLQSTLMNDLAPGVYDRVHPSVGMARIHADTALTFELNLQNGVARAMEEAERQAVAYDSELEAALAETLGQGSLEPLYQPVVDAGRRTVVGYHAISRGPFYSPLRLPDVLDAVARQSPLVVTYGIQAREQAVAGAGGLMPEELLFLGSAAVELPNAAIVAVSEFYSLNRALVPQHVVFDLNVADLWPNTASTIRTLTNVREMGFQLAVSDVGAQFTLLELVQQANPEFLSLDPMLVAGAATDPTCIDTVQLLLRFAARIGAQVVAPDLRTHEQLEALRGVGVELFRGDLVAAAETRLPKVSFSRLGL